MSLSRKMKNSLLATCGMKSLYLQHLSTTNNSLTRLSNIVSLPYNSMPACGWLFACVALLILAWPQPGNEKLHRSKAVKESVKWLTGISHCCLYWREGMQRKAAATSWQRSLPACYLYWRRKQCSLSVTHFALMPLLVCPSLLLP